MYVKSNVLELCEKLQTWKLKFFSDRGYFGIVIIIMRIYTNVIYVAI